MVGTVRLGLRFLLELGVVVSGRCTTGMSWWTITWCTISILSTCRTKDTTPVHFSTKGASMTLLRVERHVSPPGLFVSFSHSLYLDHPSNKEPHRCFYTTGTSYYPNRNYYRNMCFGNLLSVPPASLASLIVLLTIVKLAVNYGKLLALEVCLVGVLFSSYPYFAPWIWHVDRGFRELRRYDWLKRESRIMMVHAIHIQVYSDWEGRWHRNLNSSQQMPVKASTWSSKSSSLLLRCSSWLI